MENKTILEFEGNKYVKVLGSNNHEKCCFYIKYCSALIKIGSNNCKKCCFYTKSEDGREECRCPNDESFWGCLRGNFHWEEIKK